MSVNRREEPTYGGLVHDEAHRGDCATELSQRHLLLKTAVALVPLGEYSQHTRHLLA